MPEPDVDTSIQLPPELLVLGVLAYLGAVHGEVVFEIPATLMGGRALIRRCEHVDQCGGGVRYATVHGCTRRGRLVRKMVQVMPTVP